MADGLGSMTVEEMLGAVGSRTPAPGGGAVAALAGALGAALGRMAAGYSDRGEGAEEAAGIAARLESSRAVLLRLADEDAAAFERFQALSRLGADDPARAGLGEAAREAAGVPLAVVGASAGVVRMAEELGPVVNTWLRSDLAICAILAEASARSAAWMVRVNLPGVREHAGAGEAERALAECEATLASVSGGLARALERCAG